MILKSIKSYFRKEARKKIEEILGKLDYTELVHHIDCNIFNNDISNLVVLTDKLHMQVHAKLRKMKKIRDIKIIFMYLFLEEFLLKTGLHNIGKVQDIEPI
jgi:hypothetical protein